MVPGGDPSPASTEFSDISINSPALRVSSKAGVGPGEKGETSSASKTGEKYGSKEGDRNKGVGGVDAPSERKDKSLGPSAREKVDATI